LARLLTLLAVVTPYMLAAQLAWLRLGVKVSPMGIGKVVQRLRESVDRYSAGWSPYLRTAEVAVQVHHRRLRQPWCGPWMAAC
jgi:hypothetical protein